MLTIFMLCCDKGVKVVEKQRRSNLAEPPSVGDTLTIDIYPSICDAYAYGLKYYLNGEALGDGPAFAQRFDQPGLHLLHFSIRDAW